MRKSSKILIAFLSFSAVLLVVVSCFLISKNGVKGFDREKTITFKVIANDEITDYTLTTRKEYLREALEEKTLVSGRVDDNGMFVTSVDGITADEEKNEVWVIKRGNEPLEQSIDFTKIKDGEIYIAKLETQIED